MKKIGRRFLRILAFPVGVFCSPLWVLIWAFTGKQLIWNFMSFACEGKWETDVSKTVD